MTAHEIAAECRARLQARAEHAMDVGGVRTIELKGIVMRVIEGVQNGYDDENDGGAEYEQQREQEWNEWFYPLTGEQNETN